ncbi:MAG TPA: hypothetical protein VFQ60_00395 [Patescibacteria group bacterium]|nr:hypothetical protein [Patescibacteria group bacterium]
MTIAAEEEARRNASGFRFAYQVLSRDLCAAALKKSNDLARAEYEAMSPEGRAALHSGVLALLGSEFKTVDVPANAGEEIFCPTEEETENFRRLFSQRWLATLISVRRYVPRGQSIELAENLWPRKSMQELSGLPGNRMTWIGYCYHQLRNDLADQTIVAELMDGYGAAMRAEVEKRGTLECSAEVTIRKTENGYEIV